MSRWPANPSLRVELSVWLAVQSLAALALVCWFVFVAIGRHLESRQSARLREMELLIVHLVDAADATFGVEEISHLLGDLSSAHDEFRLELIDSSGRTLPVHQAGHYAELALDFEGSLLGRTFTLQTAGHPSEPFDVRLSLDTRHDEQLLRRLAWTLVGGVVFGTLINCAATFWRVRRDLAPVGRLVEQIDTLDAEQLQRRLSDIGQPTELLPLVARFNELLDRLDTSYRQMASFDADVAHELNTPLATLVTSNEIALHSNADRDTMRDLLGSNLEQLERLAGIVRDMLFLSMSNRGTRARTRTEPSLAALAQSVIEFHDAALEAAGVAIEVIGDASADVDSRLLRRALSNLIDNATRFADKASLVQVHVDPVESGRVSGVRITVSNVGPTIPPAALSRLFDRFYQLSDAGPDRGDATDEHRTSKRHGLGLSIVEAIAHMHGGHTVAHSASRRTTLGLVLPVRSPASREVQAGVPDRQCTHT